MDHIHFVGKNYYSRASFEKEANQFGINRRISFDSFKKINPGDRVFLAQGSKKGCKIFGYFTVSGITIQNKNLIKKLEEEGLVEKDIETAIASTLVTRGCGSYSISGYYKITDMNDTFNYIKEHKETAGSLMIGGSFHTLNNAGIDKEFVCSNIPFRMGFRTFNFSKFKDTYNVFKDRKKVRIPGMFYGENGENNDIKNTTCKNGIITEINNYKRK